MLRRLAASAATILLLAGCSRQTRVDAGNRAQILHFGNGAEPRDLDPGTQESQVEYVIDTALFEALVNVANDGVTILPGVAERWEVSADGLVYTFHLRADARWSDGTPVTAGDFEYAFRRAFSPNLPSPNNAYGFAIAGATDMSSGKGTALGARALDPRTFELRLAFPAPYILYIVSGAPFEPVPRAVVERFGGGSKPGTAWTRPGNLVGNGAFVLKSWTPNRDLVVVRNPRYWGRDRVRLREIRFYPTSDPAEEERDFRAGQVHTTFALPMSKIGVYRRQRDPRLHVTPQLNTLYVVINGHAPPFEDVRVRRAFALAIDRDRLVPAADLGAADPAHSLTRPGTGGYHPPGWVDFDPVLARRLLAEAGYPGGVGFPAVVLRAPSDFHRPLIEAVQESWRKVLGVRATVETSEFKTFIDEVLVKRYQLAFMGFFYGVEAPETMLMVTQGASQWNYAGWKDPAIDRAFDAANHARNQAARWAAIDTIERQVQADAAYIPIGFSNQCYLVSPALKGWRDNALAVIDWRELYLEP